MTSKLFPSYLLEKMWNEKWIAQSRVPESTLCNPMDYTVHGILQARILEWVTVLFSRGSSQPRDRTQPGLLHCRRILFQLSHQGSPRILEWVAYPFSRGSSQPRNWTRVSCILGRFIHYQLNHQGGPKKKCIEV